MCYFMKVDMQHTIAQNRQIYKKLIDEFLSDYELNSSDLPESRNSQIADSISAQIEKLLSQSDVADGIDSDMIKNELNTLFSKNEFLNSETFKLIYNIAFPFLLKLGGKNAQ